MTALKTDVGAQPQAVVLPFAPSSSVPQTDVQRAIEAVYTTLSALITASVAGLVSFKGDWDASAGTFPGAGAAKAGWLYRVSVAGTVDSIPFSVGDSILARVNNASTSTYSPNWQKAEGIITEAEVSAALGFTFSANAKTFNAAANYAAMTALLSAFTGDGGSGGVKGLVPAPASGDATKTLRGDGTWVSGGSGDVVGQASSVDGEGALFSGTGGKTIKRLSVTGLLKAAAGVISQAVAGTDYYNPGGTDVAVADGGTGASSAASAATNLGLGTGDSPQFTAVNLGHASDTTVDRSAAGRMAVEGKDALLKGQTDDLSTAGYTSTSVSQGTKSSGTFTPAYASGSVQHATNGGAHTLAPPSGHGTMIIDYTNDGSAGAVTTSGFTKVVGSMATTNALKYRLFISTSNAGSLLTIQAMQ